MTATVPDALATRSYRIEGVATLLSSLSHGGESGGTTQFLRREKIITPAGVTEVPIVSGNALRGLLRDHAAHVFWTALGRPALPVPVFHLLWSGGSLGKTGSGHTLGARQLADLRRLVPLVSLFGGSGAGKIIEGKLSVGKLVPVCTETAHMLPDDLAETASMSMWDLLQIEEFTRRDDSKRDQLHTAIEGFAPAQIEAELFTVEPHAKAVEATDGPAQQMRYGVETIAAGTQLYWWMAARQVTDLEAAMLAAAIDSWISDGAHIGGRSATGHGRLKLDVHQWTHSAPTLTVGDALAIPDGSTPGDLLTEHCTSYSEAIAEALGWFA